MAVNMDVTTGNPAQTYQLNHVWFMKLAVMCPAELVWRAIAPVISFLLVLGGSGVCFIDCSVETYPSCISFNLWR
jgi:hypothetical protein